jgi:hypothetical protein
VVTSVNCKNHTTPHSRVLLEKLIIIQQLEYFSEIYRPRMFITAFTRAHQFLFSEGNSVHTLPSYFLMIHFNITLPYALRYDNHKIQIKQTLRTKFTGDYFNVKAGGIYSNRCNF